MADFDNCYYGNAVQGGPTPLEEPKAATISSAAPSESQERAAEYAGRYGNDELAYDSFTAGWDAHVTALAEVSKERDAIAARLAAAEKESGEKSARIVELEAFKRDHTDASCTNPVCECIEARFAAQGRAVEAVRVWREREKIKGESNSRSRWYSRLNVMELNDVLRLVDFPRKRDVESPECARAIAIAAVVDEMSDNGTDIGNFIRHDIQIEAELRMRNATPQILADDYLGTCSNCNRRFTGSKRDVIGRLCRKCRRVVPERCGFVCDVPRGDVAHNPRADYGFAHHFVPQVEERT